MNTSEGRWGGRLTRRPLPEDDAEIDALSDSQRRELSAIWLGRAASELRVSEAFEVIGGALAELGSNAGLTALAARAVNDEQRHSELSRVIASRFAGRKLEAPARLSLKVPEHPGAAPKLLLSLHVVGQCAMNETLASAFLEVSLRRSSTALARAAARELLIDEIDHARIGWAHLAELRGPERSALVPWLPSMLRANLKMWRDAHRHGPSDPELCRHGVPPVNAVEDALLGAVRGLILPGLEQFGLATTGMRAWLAEGAPTA